MLKLDEASNPISCFNRAREFEMLFVLLARDESAPVAIRAWCDRIKRGKNKADDPQIMEALRAAQVMHDQRRNGLLK